MKTITIGVPTKLKVNAATINDLMRSFPLLKDYNHTMRIFSGFSNIHHSRSIMLTEWYDTSDDTDLFAFIDSDQTFEFDDINNLVNMRECDVAVGLYRKADGGTTCFAVDHAKFMSGEDTRLLYASTGIMLIRRSICTKIIDYLAEEYNYAPPRFSISRDYTDIIPFFAEKFVENDQSPNSQKIWLGEDYSFSWLVRKAGGVIRGLMSETIGHQVAQIKYLNLSDQFKKHCKTV